MGTKIWQGQVLWRGYVHPHTYPHTQLKKSGILHTHTQSMWGFPVKMGTSLGNTHGGGFVTSLAHPSSGPRGCQVTTARCTPTPHPSPSIHTGWVVASGNRTPNLTFNTPGKPADATSCAATQLVASAGVPEVLKVRLGVRFPLATTHPV